MVKVVGKAPDSVKTVICTNCGSKLEYTQSEVKEQSSTDYGGGPDGKEWIKCPQCDKEVILKSW